MNLRRDCGFEASLHGDFVVRTVDVDSGRSVATKFYGPMVRGMSWKVRRRMIGITLARQRKEIAHARAD